MKHKRQETILALIKERVCLTQEDLLNGLIEKGFNVTQSTISRDISELKLSKGRDKDGKYRYLSNEEVESKDSRSHYRALISRSVISISYALNNVVIKCNAGMASSVCVAVDEMFGDKMLGSLAGEDTIIIVTSCEEDSLELTESLKLLL